MTEPLQRRTNDDGGKYYEHPSRTEEIPEPNGSYLVRPARYDSVTTVLSVYAKPALVFWSGNLSARRALENLPKLIAAARIDDCGRARAKSEPHGCGVCVACAEAWVALFHVGEKERRAREGTAAHDVLERWTLTGEWVYIPRADWGDLAPTQEQMAPYIRRLQQFVADYALTPESWVVAECTVYHHGIKVAGTLDGIIDVKPLTKLAADFCARINHANGLDPDAPVRVVLDCKSREGEGTELYGDHPLQLAPYRFAETMMPKLAAPEMETEMVATDGAAILQVRPDGYAFRPVVTNGDTMKAFRGLLDAYRWNAAHGERDTQVKAFPRPDGWKPPTWQRMTDPTGVLCGCAYCDEPGDSRCQFTTVLRPKGRHTKNIPAPKPILAPSAKLSVSEPGDDLGQAPKPARKAPARRASPRRSVLAAAAEGNGGTVPSATLESMRTRSRTIGAEISDDQIPF